MTGTAATADMASAARDRPTSAVRDRGRANAQDKRGSSGLRTHAVAAGITRTEQLSCHLLTRLGCHMHAESAKCVQPSSRYARTELTRPHTSSVHQKRLTTALSQEVAVREVQDLPSQAGTHNVRRASFWAKRTKAQQWVA